MLPEGVGRLFSVGGMIDGPFPEHYEPVESPIAKNPLHEKITHNPTARIFQNDAQRMATAPSFPMSPRLIRLRNCSATGPSTRT